MWSEGAVTDRAIELLRMHDAKRDATGVVVPRHRYSRHLRHVIYEATWNIDPYGSRSFTLRYEDRGYRWGYVCEIDGPHSTSGNWAQRGECWSDEEAYDPAALAVCRALLNYVDEDDEEMTEDAVIAMLEGWVTRSPAPTAERWQQVLDSRPALPAAPAPGEGHTRPTRGVVRLRQGTRGVRIGMCGAVGSSADMLTVSRVVLLIGVVLILLASAGVQFGPLDLFKLGVGVALAAGLVP